ncbi:MAG: hypothetical protein P8Y71_30615 [Pseudolabrys sp.]
MPDDRTPPSVVDASVPHCDRRDRTPPSVVDASVPHCDRRDGGAMELARSSPRIGSLPELRTFRCARCGHVETIEVR